MSERNTAPISSRMTYRMLLTLEELTWDALAQEAAKRRLTGAALIAALLEAWAYPAPTPATATRPRYIPPSRAVRWEDPPEEPLDPRDDEG